MSISVFQFAQFLKRCQYIFTLILEFLVFEVPMEEQESHSMGKFQFFIKILVLIKALIKVLIKANFI